AWKAVPPPAEVTPRTLRKVTGNVRTSALSVGRHWHAAAKPRHRFPGGLWPLVTQHCNSRVCRSDAERVQMVWRASSMRCPRDHAGSRIEACGLLLDGGGSRRHSAGTVQVSSVRPRNEAGCPSDLLIRSKIRVVRIRPRWSVWP